MNPDRFGVALMAVAALLAGVWLAGYVAASLLVPPGTGRRLERLGWGLALGLALLASGVGLGYSLALRVPAVASVFLLVGGVWAGRRFPLPPEPREPAAASPRAAEWPSTILRVVLGLLLGWGLAAFLLRALTEPIWSNDFLAIWGLKGKTFFFEGAIALRFFDWGSFEFSNPGYPLGLPLLYAAFASLLGSWDDHAIALVFAGWLVATLMVLYGWLRRRGASATVALAAAAALAHFEGLYSSFLTGMAEIPVAFALLLVGTAFTDALDATDRGSMRRLMLASWCAAGTKNEGVFFVGLTLAFLGVLRLMRRGGNAPGKIALALGIPAAISVVLHRLAVGSHPVRGLDLAYLTHPDLPARILEGLGWTWRIHLRPAIWPLAAVVVLAALGSRAPHGRRLLLLAAASAAVYVLLPALCPYGTEWLARWTIGRALVALAPLATAGIAAALATTLRREPRPAFVPQPESS